VIVQNKGNTHMLAAYTPSTLNSALLMNSDTGWKQFTPIAMLISDPALVVVNAEGPAKTLKEMMELAKAKPKQVLQGGGAYGSSASMAGKLLEEAAGVSVSYTPFKGGGEAILQLLGKHIHFVIENPGEVAQHIQAGKLRAIASSDRIAQMPDVPTYAEAGFKVRTLTQFRAVMAPPGIPPEVARYYVGLLDRTRQTPQWKEYVKKSGVVENWMTGAELTTLFDQEEKEYQRLNREMGLSK
jgi:putative tricarboxylic transport membrane protein